MSDVSRVRQFRSTSAQGLNQNSFVTRLWHKAKRLGVWDPMDIDFTQDRQDWLALAPEEREVLLHLTSMFLGGEESVTLDLLPLIGVVAAEGRLEEEMYLTTFLFEEAKHVEAFRRFLDEVACEHTDLGRYHGPAYQSIFGEALPQALGRLRQDPSPLAQAEASVTYNMIVEGVLAETGYHAYFAVLEARNIMPGMREVVGKLKQDESRHLAYGVYLLSRLVAEHGEPIWQAIENRMNTMLPLAVNMIGEIFAPYDPMPFDLELTRFVDFATHQFQRRYERIYKAQGQRIEDVLRDA